MRLTREREILRAKTRVHDEIGHALLQTRQFLSDVQGDAESVCAAWRQNARLLLGGDADEQPAVDASAQLAHAAREIGVTIEREGVFPAEGTENAHLVETAAHECLTNLVRHAGGSRLEISGEESRLRMARSLPERRRRPRRPHRRGQRPDRPARPNGSRRLRDGR